MSGISPHLHGVQAALHEVVRSKLVELLMRGSARYIDARVIWQVQELVIFPLSNSPSVVVSQPRLELPRAHVHARRGANEVDWVWRVERQ